MPLSAIGQIRKRRSHVANNGSLGKPRRQRQRERHQTKGLTRRKMAVHVRFKSLYIFSRLQENNSVK